jgi:hypothetical protein
MEGAKTILDQREFNSRRQHISEKMFQKQLIERDQKLAQEHEMYRKALGDR